MTTLCPDCGKYIDRRDIVKHLAAHDRANDLGKTLDKLAELSDADLAKLLAKMRKGGRA